MTEQADQAHPNAAQTRVTVAEAAQLLSLTAEAVRSRVQRGTLPSVKEDGTVYVLLDAAQTDERASTQAHLSGDQTEFIASLQEQIDWLRREVERKDTLLMSLMQRIPELEAPPEPREAPVNSSEEPHSTHAPPGPQDPSQRRSWWRQFFGLE